MTRILLGSLLVLGLLASGGPARAQDVDPEHHSVGLGFHDTDAPIGLRWWFSGQKVALDAGIGFESLDTGDDDLNSFALDVGVPILLRSWDRFHFLVRPGLLFETEEVIVLGEEEQDKFFAITGELEAEVFLTDNVSFSASHGIAVINRDPAVGEDTTDFGTIGRNFTEVGFHVYLFGSTE